MTFDLKLTPQVSTNLVTLQTCLAAMMGRPLTLDQLRQDVGLMVERITHVTMMLQRSQLRMEEYVCLKVIAMLSQRMSYFINIKTVVFNSFQF